MTAASLTVRVKQAIAVFSILSAVCVSVLELEIYHKGLGPVNKEAEKPIVCCPQAGGTEGAAVCFEGLRAGEPGMWTPV